MDTSPDLAETLRALALADLGQKVLNAITTTAILGHANLRHSRMYVHTDDLAVRLIASVIEGDAKAAVAAQNAWAEGSAAEIYEKYRVAEFRPPAA